jgi:hypothetical protein
MNNRITYATGGLVPSNGPDSTLVKLECGVNFPHRVYQILSIIEEQKSPNSSFISSENKV